MALATQTQVEQRLQIDFTSASDPVCAELLAAAAGHIERVVGRDLESASRSETFDPPQGCDLWLTNTPITTLTSVTVNGTALASTGYSHDPETGRLTRVSGGLPRGWAVRKVQSIVVAYTGGYTTVPYDIQDICAWSAARAFQAGAAFASVPAGAEGIKQVSLAGSDSVTYADVSMNAAKAAIGLLPEEVEVLDYYRHRFA